MASISGILSPNIENSLQELERESVAQPVPSIGWGEYAQTSWNDSFKNSATYSLVGMAMGRGSPVYDTKQLQIIYPDVPQDYWKDSANAFQAEILYDRYKTAQEKQELYNLI